MSLSSLFGEKSIHFAIPLQSPVADVVTNSARPLPPLTNVRKDGDKKLHHTFFICLLRHQHVEVKVPFTGLSFILCFESR